ncbi:hypothetical protein YK48G_18610 [Lentilactobacillus fungorum]|uniref:Uncharacterized protein n=1 Tax=Lentilactobacillus fungorum TaxID=2201250 RepID=A0ABQ3W157_9LACO|nr:hypothetical protein [Lentilactobacillus fungorum]GHP14436.1 hypothetical protein YK48G_18610 [Lentilactobacillus fungorum]
MTKFDLMMQLQLTFLQFNSFAIQTNQPAFFTKEFNDTVIVYTVPNACDYFIPTHFYDLIQEIKRYDGSNLYYADTLFDLVEIDIQIRKEGLSECN